MSVVLNYGQQGRFECVVPEDRVLAFYPAPEPIADLASAVRQALEEPLDFPPLSRAVVPGDQVVLALDRHTPQGATLIAAVYEIIAAQGVDPANILILQPTALAGPKVTDPRTELPEAVRNVVQWRVHDATDATQQAYLATTANGERIYLDRDVVHADFVMSIGQIGFDPVLGYRGTNTVLYPGLSSTSAVQKARGFGHQELTPEDDRPLRQLVDEIGWLLGIQFSLQVLPSRGNGVSSVIAGFEQSVWHRGRELLAAQREVELVERAETVVISIDADAAGHGWEQVGAALATARSLVVRGGKVVILSELNGACSDLSDGMRLVRDVRSPREALKPLRDHVPPDFLPATQLAQMADWAKIYLLSHLDSTLVEDLFMIPLDSEQEVSRLLAGTSGCAFIEGAQHTHGRLQLASDDE
ncbi:MAG: lactate racemase domain-containing protein [Planctomycetota bacterium]